MSVVLASRSRTHHSTPALHKKLHIKKVNDLPISQAAMKHLQALNSPVDRTEL